MSIALASCASSGLENAEDIDQAIGVAPGENAALCISAMIDPAWTESNMQYDRVEGPQLTKLQDLTPDQIVAVAELTPEQISAFSAGAVKPRCLDE